MNNLGYLLEIDVVNQIENGNEYLVTKGIIPENTYTTYIYKKDVDEDFIIELNLSVDVLSQENLMIIAQEFNDYLKKEKSKE